MASNAAKYFLAGALFIAISFTTLITSDSITDHLGIETTNDCTDDDEDDCYEWPNETGCTIILGILCMGLIGLYCLVLSITSLVVGEGEKSQTNVQMIPGGPQPQPEEGKKRAIMAIAHNKPVIPMDGNVERLIKRIFYLKKEKEINKKNLLNKKSFFDKSKRSRDYAQAIMEIGALICKPKNPLCFKCPISKNCISYKKNDFEIITKIKSNKVKYFEAEICNNKDKYLLIKNYKFNFLKNFFIFPMKEVEKKKFISSLNKKINIKMSNMDMKIVLKKKAKFTKIKNSFMLDKNNPQSVILPSFTKKIFKSISNY